MDLASLVLLFQLVNPTTAEFIPAAEHDWTCCQLQDDTYWCGLPTAIPPLACKDTRLPMLTRYDALLYLSSTVLEANCFRKVPVQADPVCQSALAVVDLGKPAPVNNLITWLGLPSLTLGRAPGDYMIVVRGAGPAGAGPYSPPSEPFRYDPSPATLLTPGQPIIRP